MTIRIVQRADDIGSSLIANEAIVDAHKDGLVKNTSIMVPAPHFEDAARRLQDCPDLELGLHATITDEWSSDRWGPILPVADVASIVYDDGTFYTSCTDLWERYGDEKTRPSNEQIMNELAAQLAKARAFDLDIRYLDTHMGFDWFHGLSDLLQGFCDDEGLIYANAMKLERLPKLEEKHVDPVETMLAQLRACEDGKTYLHVGHPAYARGDMMDMAIRNSGHGEVARDRNIQRLMFMDERIVQLYDELGIESIAYSAVT